MIPLEQESEKKTANLNFFFGSILAILSTVFIGFNVFVQWLLFWKSDYLNAFDTAMFWSFFILGFSLSFSKYKGFKVFDITPKQRFYAIVWVIGSATGLAFFAALMYIPPSKLMLVSNTTPILLIFLYFFIFKEHIYLKEFICTLTAFGGIALMSFAK